MNDRIGACQSRNRRFQTMSRQTGWLLAVLACLLPAAVTLTSFEALAQSEAASSIPSASAAVPSSEVPSAAAPNLLAPNSVDTTPPGAGEPKTRVIEEIIEPVDPSTLPHDLSPWGMFLNADLIVKAVMSSLAFASLVTWTIGIAKWLEIAAGGRNLRRGIDILASAQNLRQAEVHLANTAGLNKGVVAKLVSGAISEAERSRGLPAEGIKERATALLSRIEVRATRTMTRGIILLGTIGATSPFVGLFGTVWGIMNSFIGISKANTTNLAVVAPGIAEALQATAIGLVAAIPAVVIYNVFSRSIAGYKGILGDASTEVLRHLSRDLDRAESGDKEWYVPQMRQVAE